MNRKKSSNDSLFYPRVNLPLFPVFTLLFFFLSLILTANLYGANTKKEFDQGNQAIAEGKLDEAIIFFQSILKRKPKNGEAFFNKGLAEYKKGDYKTAEESFLSAANLIKKKKTSSLAYYNAGNAAYKRGDINQAISHLYRSLELDPNNKEAAHNLQKLREEKNKSDGQSNKGENSQKQDNQTQQNDSEKKSEQDKQNKEENQQSSQKDQSKETPPSDSQNKNEKAQAILDKERENNAKRQNNSSMPKREVEKDW